jgi:hypothetical protein
MGQSVKSRQDSVHVKVYILIELCRKTEGWCPIRVNKDIVKVLKGKNKLLMTTAHIKKHSKNYVACSHNMWLRQGKAE